MQTVATSNDWVVEYEVQSSRRYRRFLSLVMLAADCSTDQIVDQIKAFVRTCDAYIVLDNRVAILMGETDKSGALFAVARFRRHCPKGLNLHFGVATFPLDGRDANTLIETAEHRLEVARAFGGEAVVWSDVWND